MTVTLKLNPQPKKATVAKDATVVKNRPEAKVKVVIGKSLEEKSLMELASTPLRHVQPAVFASKGSPFKAKLSHREIVHCWW